MKTFALGQALPTLQDGPRGRADTLLRAAPSRRTPPLKGAAASVLRRILPELEGGTLVVELPDGSTHRFGHGPEQVLHLTDLHALNRIALRGSIGFGEAYQAGEWHADDLPALLDLLLSNADDAVASHGAWWHLLESRPRLNRRNGIVAARRKIQYHYDLGNDLFELFLDPSMTYSCALYDDPHDPGISLAEAQQAKRRLMADTLGLTADSHVLEIGCGWGSFAITAAQRYGARVTGVTISHEQALLARKRVAEAGVADRVEILEQDYRTLPGQGVYTHVASVEMVEAIGEPEFETYFRTIDRLLAPGGSACIQSILVPDQRWKRYHLRSDWMERYIFPGCCIPSVGALVEAAASSSRLKLRGMEEFGAHYAPTLREWRTRFFDRLDEVRALGYDEHFIRTWDLYLAFSEASFRQRRLGDGQLLFAR